MNDRNWLVLRVVVGLVAALVLSAASAQAQATRTWVSGVGDDANPCSRTAPCKTFAGAISKTAARGEINCLDPGGYGGLTITKSITIKCFYTLGGVLSAGAGVNGIVVNALNTDDVLLEGLDMNGSGTAQTGLRILQARSVKVVKSEIYGYVTGIGFVPSNLGARLLVVDSHIFDNRGAGVMVAPSLNTASGIATLNNNEIVGNGCGVVATNQTASTNVAVNCSALNATGGAARVNLFHNRISDSAGATAGGVGVFSLGSNAIIRIGNNEITGNATGINANGAVSPAGIHTYQDNHLIQNGVDGTPTGTLPHQ
jgi:hypothetical protein